MASGSCGCADIYASGTGLINAYTAYQTNGVCGISGLFCVCDNGVGKHMCICGGIIVSFT